MIHVTARVRLKPGTTSQFLRIFREVSVLVHREPGCLDYFPARDVDLELPNQRLQEHTITIIEKWTSRAALESHLRSGHMRSFQEHVRDLVADVRLTVVEEI